MTLSIIIFLILLGIFLLLVEFLIVPGVTVAGIAGFVLLIAGVVLSYMYLDVKQANWILLITMIINISSIFLFFRTKTWRHAGLKTEISGKVNLLDADFTEGSTGKAISRLAPGGRAMFNNKIVEVHSIDGFIDPNTEVVITSIKNNKIYIKTKTL